jgi:hypothetical protein
VKKRKEEKVKLEENSQFDRTETRGTGERD